MRVIGDRNQFTPFGLFVYEHCRQQGLSVTNIDYVFEDYTRKKIMLVEEKSNAGELRPAQGKTFRVIHDALRIASPQVGYDYWGFYILRFPPNKQTPGPGMCLNGVSVTVEQLVRHLNFEAKICPGIFDLPQNEGSKSS